jgi:ubiquinone/menaquinone biosynthesis C-methylase UbiE
MTQECGEIHHPIFSRVLARLSEDSLAETRPFRQELLAGLSGRVIEVGAGTGINFAFYPASVTEVVAVEPEPYLRSLAVQAAMRASFAIAVTAGVAEQLPEENASFDAGVVSLVLCSVRDPARALAELFRVIRPGGELRFYEHVRARGPRLAWIQRAVDALFWPRIGGGCHTSRDTRAGIEEAGFVVESCREFSFLPCFLLAPVSPHILGRARRPQESVGRSGNR